MKNNFPSINDIFFTFTIQVYIMYLKYHFQQFFICDYLIKTSSNCKL